MAPVIAGHPRTVTNALARWFLLPSSKNIRAGESSTGGRALAASYSPDEARSDALRSRPDPPRNQIAMPSHTANETTNSTPHTGPGYAPGDFGHGPGPARVDAVTAMLRYPLLVII